MLYDCTLMEKKIIIIIVIVITTTIFMIISTIITIIVQCVNQLSCTMALSFILKLMYHI